MKHILTLILFLFITFIYAQKSKNNSTQAPACNFVVSSDTSITGKVYKLGVYTIGGSNKIKAKTSNKIKTKLGLKLDQDILVTEKFFLDQFKNACSVDKVVLEKIEVLPINSSYVKVLITHIKQVRKRLVYKFPNTTFNSLIIIAVAPQTVCPSIV